MLLSFLSFFLLCGFVLGYEEKKDNLNSILQKLKQNPTNLIFLGKLGDLYVQRKKYVEAEKCYKKCLSLEPEESRHYIRLARLYDKMDRPDKAKDVITNAAYYFGRNGEVFSTLGNIEYKLGNFSNALISYEKALSYTIEKKKYYTYSGLGKTYRELKDYEKAKIFFIKALQIKQDCWTYYEFGKLFMELNDYKQAIWAFRRSKAFSYSLDMDVKKVIWKKLAEAYFKYGMELKGASKKVEARNILLKITEDRELCQTDYYEKASFWLKRL